MWHRNPSVSDAWQRKILTPAMWEYVIGNRTDCGFHEALFYPQCEAFFVHLVLSLYWTKRDGFVASTFTHSRSCRHLLWRAQFASEWQHARRTLPFDWSCCGNSTTHAVKFSATRDFVLTQVSCIQTDGQHFQQLLWTFYESYEAVVMKCVKISKYVRF